MTDPRPDEPAAIPPPPEVAAVLRSAAAVARASVPPPPQSQPPPPPAPPDQPPAQPGPVAATAAPAPTAAPPVAAPVATQLAAPGTAAIAVPPPPAVAPQRTARPGTVYGGGPPPEDDRHPDQRPALSGRLTTLHIGSHTATRAALAKLGVAPPATGLIAGIDRYQRPVPVPFFRPEPTRIGLVGGDGTGHLLAFRALALGTRVAVVTDQPGRWEGFGEHAVGLADRVAVFTSERPLAVTATAQQPALVIYDLGVAGATKPPPLAPWQTQLTILRRLDRSGLPALQECHLVMLHRLTEPEATTVGTALRLSDRQVQLLQVMSDDMLALLGGSTDQYVWLAQTELEQRYVDPPPAPPAAGLTPPAGSRPAGSAAPPVGG